MIFEYKQKKYILIHVVKEIILEDQDYVTKRLKFEVYKNITKLLSKDKKCNNLTLKKLNLLKRYKRINKYHHVAFIKLDHVKCSNNNSSNKTNHSKIKQQNIDEIVKSLRLKINNSSTYEKIKLLTEIKKLYKENGNLIKFSETNSEIMKLKMSF